MRGCYYGVLSVPLLTAVLCFEVLHFQHSVAFHHFLTVFDKFDCLCHAEFPGKPGLADTEESTVGSRLIDYIAFPEQICSKPNSLLLAEFKESLKVFHCCLKTFLFEEIRICSFSFPMFLGVELRW